MRFYFLLTPLLFAALPLHAQIDLNASERAALGKKVWQNECGGTVSGLTTWNSGENFGSFGIGHFIWYSPGNRNRFEESFPKLISFLKQRGKNPPAFIERALPRGCPWSSKTEFERAKNSPEMKAFRQYLVDTIPGQTAFLIARFNAAVPKILSEAPANQRNELKKRLREVGSTTRGAFALVDYVNFKGEGISKPERYRGQGWGLLQVLQAMTGRGNPVDDFSDAAGRVLTQRVQNSPSSRNEKRWLTGWLNRVNRY